MAAEPAASHVAEPYDAVGAGSRGPLIVTEDDELIEALLKLCAAAGAEPQVVCGAPPPRQVWESAPLVLVGVDVAERMSAVSRRPGVVLVGSDLDDGGVWQKAVSLGAEQVVFLPDCEPWLLDRVADAAEGAGAPALTVAVLGGRGGAGASTLACALAVTAAREGRRTVLVDVDPLGGGLDVLLGGEEAVGLRWPDLAASRGRVNAVELEQSLPRVHRLAALSWDRGDRLTIPVEAVRTVLGAARRRGGVVVLDLPRRIDAAAAEALEQADLGLLVVPGELRAMAASSRVAASVGMRLSDLRAVVRGPSPSGMTGEEVARGLRLPLAGELGPEPGLTADLECGRPPGARPKGPLGRFCTAFLTEALAGAGLGSGRADSARGAHRATRSGGGKATGGKGTTHGDGGRRGGIDDEGVAA
ncbi:septum site-determining protein Ssd [Streptacidiphilus sp. MAP5-3]|uniref:septum site-determining protein Ssd n=1 Tax=unclassified Streptacidiphilus TaxID=2643834 RepID=UPI0035163006